MIYSPKDLSEKQWKLLIEYYKQSYEEAVVALKKKTKKIYKRKPKAKRGK